MYFTNLWKGRRNGSFNSFKGNVQRQTVTERCYRLRLQLEDGTGGREGETENDWKLEMGKCERESKRETAENWSRERLQRG